MSGIFPDSGVPAYQALNTVEVDTVNCDDELFHSTQRCQPRFDPAAANAIMSELLNTVALGGGAYDCSRLDNLSGAISALLNGLRPCTAQKASAEQVAGLTGNEPLLTCINGENVAISIDDLPFVDAGDLNGAIASVSPCTAPAASQAEIDALSGAESLLVCINGTPKRVSINDLPSGGGQAGTTINIVGQGISFAGSSVYLLPPSPNGRWFVTCVRFTGAGLEIADHEPPGIYPDGYKFSAENPADPGTFYSVEVWAIPIA